MTAMRNRTVNLSLGRTCKPVNPLALRLEREFLKLHRKLSVRGLDICARPTVLPTIDFFPIRFGGDVKTAEAIAQILARLCGVDDYKFSVRELSDVDETFRQALPRYANEKLVFHSMLEPGDSRRYTIRVMPRVLSNSKTLTGELLRQVTQIALTKTYGISIGRPNRSGFLVDLAAVYLGCGILAANAAFEFQKRSTGMAYEWSVHRSSALSETEYGYALALYAMARGEKSPVWAKYLDANVRSAFRASGKMLSQRRRGEDFKLCR